MARRKNIAKSTIEIAEERPSLTFEQAVELFIGEQKILHRANRTIDWYRENLHTLRVFLERQQLNTDIDAITTTVLKHNYILYMLETLHLSPVTVKGRIRTLQSFFSLLYEQGYVRTNPAATLVPPKTRKTIIETFSRDQLRLLLDAPDRTTFTGYRDYTIMTLLLETGMRVSEAANLKLQDVRWNDNALLVLGKGNKERLVPFQHKMRTVLKRYVEIRGNINAEDHLFLTVDDLPMDKRRMQERIHDYGVAKDIRGVRVSPHTFRHTFAKLYIKNGGDAFSLQSILGHSSLDMVRHYVNLFSSDVQEQDRKYSPLEHL